MVTSLLSILPAAPCGLGMLFAGVGDHGVWATAPHPDQGTIHQQLEEILSRSEFGSGARQSDWLRRLVEKVAAFFTWLGELHASAPVLYWLLLGLCALVLVAVVLFVALKIRLVFHRGYSARTRDAEKQTREQFSRLHREEANRCAGRGDFTEAIRFLFLSLVYRFDESGRVLFPRAYTNREYLQLFDDRPAMASLLVVFVDILDDRWYGQRATEEQQYRHCLELYERLS